MSNKKRNIILSVFSIIMVGIMVLVLFLAWEDSKNEGNLSEVVSSDASSTINVEDIESENDNTEGEIAIEDEEIEFLEPDETEADKILENNKSNSSENNSSATKNNSSTKKENKPKKESEKKENQKDETQSFEEGKEELENTATEYLKKHNIDPKTAGETGETCSNCGKKIWNPDKYGLFIPGMPEDYENSGYCLGTCGISLK